MNVNTQSTKDIFDFLDDIPFRIIKEVNSFELIPKNSIMGVLDDNLDSDIEEWNNALPTTKITPIRGIGTQTYSSDTSNIQFRVFNTLGYQFSDGTEISICANGNDGIELVSLKIADNKKGIGLDNLLFELFLAFCQKSLQFIPTIKITLGCCKNQNKNKIGFFERFQFKIDISEENFTTLIRKEQQFYDSI